MTRHKLTAAEGSPSRFWPRRGAAVLQAYIDDLREINQRLRGLLHWLQIIFFPKPEQILRLQRALFPTAAHGRRF